MLYRDFIKMIRQKLLQECEIISYDAADAIEEISQHVASDIC